LLVEPACGLIVPFVPLWAPVDPLPLIDPGDEPVVEFEMSAPPVPELILLEPGLPVVPVELEPDVPTELPVEVPAPPLALPCANARELVITSIAANPMVFSFIEFPFFWIRKQQALGSAVPNVSRKY